MLLIYGFFQKSEGGKKKKKKKRTFQLVNANQAQLDDNIYTSFLQLPLALNSCIYLQSSSSHRHMDIEF
jgi:hypothetical protein